MDVYVCLVPTVSSRVDHCESEVCVARHYIIAATDNSLFTITHSISRLLHARCTYVPVYSGSQYYSMAFMQNLDTLNEHRTTHHWNKHTQTLYQSTYTPYRRSHKQIDKKKEWKKESPTKETVRQRKREVKYDEAK